MKGDFFLQFESISSPILITECPLRPNTDHAIVHYRHLLAGDIYIYMGVLS